VHPCYWLIVMAAAQAEVLQVQAVEEVLDIAHITSCAAQVFEI
jgi:hypothetical protein